MRRSAPLLAVIALAAIGGITWLAVSLLDRAAPEGGVARDSNALTPTPTSGSMPSVDGAPVEKGALERGGSARSELATPRAAGDLQIVEGRLSLPLGIPRDERAVVFATSTALLARELNSKDGAAEVAWGGGEHAELIARTEADAQGAFRLEIPAGARRVHLGVTGRYLYSDATVPVLVPQSGVVLAPELGGRITGRLVAPSGEPRIEPVLEALEVKLAPDLGSGFDAFAVASRVWPRRALTDAEGRFELRAVPADSPQTLIIKPEGVAAAAQDSMQLRGGEHLEVQVPLVRGANLSGTVVDEAGAPVAGVKVTVRLRGLLGRMLEDLREVESDEQGRFDLVAVMPGAVDVNARAEGYRDANLRLEGVLLDGDQRTRLALVLERGGSIAGHVRHGDGSPAAGAVIVAGAVFNPMSPMAGDAEREFRDTADDTGRFELSGLAGGRYRLSASLDVEQGAQAGTWKGRIESVEAGQSDLVVLLAAPIVLRGRVLAEPSGAPIESFEVVASLKGSAMMLGMGAERASERFTEREDGSFELQGLRAGAWEVRVRADGYGGSTIELVELPLAAGAPLIDFRLPPAGMVSGRVVDPEGLPVPRATVEPELDLTQRIEASMRPTVQSAMSDVEGRFLLEGLDPGAIQLIATREGWAASVPTACDVVAGELTSEVTLVLRRGGTLSGEVFDKEGRPHSGATVIVQSLPSYASQHMLRSNTDGRFEVQHLEPGRWQVVRTMDLFGEDSATPGANDDDAVADFLGSLLFEMVEITEGGSTHVVLGAPPEDPVHLTCTIVEAGKPVPQAVVSLMPDGAESAGELKLKVTDAEGRIEIDLEHGGHYHIAVQAGAVGNEQNALEFFELIPDGVEAHELKLELPGARITGTVRMKGKGALKACRVTLHVEDGIATDSMYGGHYAETATDAEGRYEITHLRPGTYTIAVGGAPMGGLLGGDSEGGRTVSPGVRVGDGEWIRDVDFEIEPAAELQGVVRDLDGRPVEGAAVFVRDEAGRLLERYSMVTTDSAGRFHFKGIAPGQYTVSARIGERASQEGARVRVHAEGSEPAIVTLEPGTLLRISVVDAEGQPVAARLLVVDGDGRDYAGMMSMEEVMEGTAQRGSFAERTIGPLPPGSFRVRAVLADGSEVEKPVSLNGRPERKVELRLR